MINYLKHPKALIKMVMLLSGLIIQISPCSDTLYQDSAVYFAPDSGHVLSKNTSIPPYMKISFEDTVNNLALTFHVYGENKNLKESVQSFFKPPTAFEYVFDTVMTDTGDTEHYYLYGKAKLNDSLTYVTFSIGKKMGDFIIILSNAMYDNPVGHRYISQFNRFRFVEETLIDTVPIDTTPPDTIVPVRTKSVPTDKKKKGIKWEVDKYYLMRADGWTYDLKGVRKYAY